MPMLFPFDPNWVESYKVDSEYKTEIITSRNYREQRIALRSQPRRKVSFLTTPSRGALAKFMGLMAAKQQQEFILPEITRKSSTGYAVLAGVTLVPLSSPTLPVWVTPGAFVVFEGASGRGFFEVVSADISGIVTAAPIEQDIPAGSTLHPGLVGRVAASLRGQHLTNTVGRMNVDFFADPGRNKHYYQGVAPAVHNGKELLLLRPNWRTTPTITSNSFLETLDYERGRFAHHQPVNFNEVVVRQEFTQRDAAETEVLSRFFQRMRGQQGEFYAPTWGQDFDLSTGALAGTSSLRTPGSETFDLYAGSPVYKSVIVFYADGSIQPNVVNSVTLGGLGNSNINVVTPWAQAVNESNVRLMCWLPTWRLAIDALSIEWLTKSVSQTQLTMKTIEDLA